MKRRHQSTEWRLLAALCLAVLAVVAFPSNAAAETEPTKTVFQNVRVLTMTDAGILENAQVTIEGDRITAVEKAGRAGKSDANATVINGAGKTLMPGLTDMHAHYFFEGDGPMYLANGVTTVRNLWGRGVHFKYDAEAKTGVHPGPHVYTCGPIIDTVEGIWTRDGAVGVNTPDEAKGAVISQKATGYMAIKPYDKLSPQMYEAAVSAAKNAGMQIWTHVPDQMTLDDVLAFDVDSIEHMTGYADAALAEGETLSTAKSKHQRMLENWARTDAEGVDAIAKKVAAAGVWTVPTLTVIDQQAEYAADQTSFFARPEIVYANPFIVNSWRGRKKSLEIVRAGRKARFGMIKALHDLDAPLLVGTDNINSFVLPGYSIHDELQNFVDAGIPVADVLKIATAEAAKFLNQEGKFGVVAKDARADLVLIDGDPLADLDVLKNPEGVMINGHWRSAGDIAGELANVASAYKKLLSAAGAAPPGQ